MKVLVIAAHPDDEVYGMGGTMAKLSDAGHEVHVLIVTDGCTAQYRNDPRLPEILAQKKEEARRANALLGVKAVHFGALPDMRLDTVSHVEVNQLIEETVDTVAPEVVYTHFYGDVNLDHQMVYRCGDRRCGSCTATGYPPLRSGVRSLATPYFCPIPWWIFPIIPPAKRPRCWPIRRKNAPILTPVPPSMSGKRTGPADCSGEWAAARHLCCCGRYVERENKEA